MASPSQANSRKSVANRERLDRPVGEQQDADATPVPLDLMDRAKVDLHQHGDDHHPDQQAHREIHLRDFQRAHRLRRCGREQAEQRAADDAEKDPERQVTLEKTQGGTCGLLADYFALAGHGDFLAAERRV